MFLKTFLETDGFQSSSSSSVASSSVASSSIASLSDQDATRMKMYEDEDVTRIKMQRGLRCNVDKDAQDSEVSI